MIGYLEGKLLKKEHDKILLLANQIGYEILLPAIVMESLSKKQTGDEISLYIYYQQTERQPKPVLIGFNLDIEKEFFHSFISVEDIGPLKAVKALSIPVEEIAVAIEEKNAKKLMQLGGIGKRTAHKIIASLKGKMDKFALNGMTKKNQIIDIDKIDNSVKQVIDVLVNQLGHKLSDAKKMIDTAFKQNSSISTPEELFDEIYSSKKN